MAKLDGKKIAFLFTDGVEQVELEKPLEAVKDEGADVDLISLEDGEIQAFNHLDHGDKIKIDKAVADADVSDYDGLVVPGGVANPDFLRMDENAMNFVRGFAKAGKPAGIICHGPWVLVETGIVDGLTVTSWPSLRTDIKNAGGNWVDEEVVVDRGIVTSRKPDDLPAFCAKIIEEFAEGKHEELAAAMSGSGSSS
jgi:protease I